MLTPEYNLLTLYDGKVLNCFDLFYEKNMPEVFEKAGKFLLLEDYIIYRLTGEFCASKSLYSSSLIPSINISFCCILSSY